LPTALYPGSFDPFHNGHLDIVEQAATMFDAVVVATMHNPDKPGGFLALDERQTLIEAAVAHLPTVKVTTFAGLAVDATKAAGADVIVKGLRTGADFDIEMQMAHTNEAVAGVRTVFLPCRPALSFVSSRFIREIAHYGGDVSSLVPPAVARRLEERS
jgi:pantetheine-phosphate adenylyltransferase